MNRRGFLKVAIGGVALAALPPVAPASAPALIDLTALGRWISIDTTDGEFRFALPTFSESGRATVSITAASDTIVTGARVVVPGVFEAPLVYRSGWTLRTGDTFTVDFPVPVLTFDDTPWWVEQPRLAAYKGSL